MENGEEADLHTKMLSGSAAIVRKVSATVAEQNAVDDGLGFAGQWPPNSAGKVNTTWK